MAVSNDNLNGLVGYTSSYADFYSFNLLSATYSGTSTSPVLSSATVQITGSYADESAIFLASTTSPGFPGYTNTFQFGPTINNLVTFEIQENGVTTASFKSAAVAFAPGAILFTVPRVSNPTGGALFSTDPIATGSTLNLTAAGVYAGAGDVGDSVACYARGTRIATPDGTRTIERLSVGDLVLNHAGEACPVIWLGHRRIDCRRRRSPREVWPVRVAREAFGVGQPHADLLLSPDHSVFVGGVLIPIQHLINDATITQVPVDEVEYWHVELPRHDILLAEGLPCESYLDPGNRAAFANSTLTEVRASFGRDGDCAWEVDACAPLVQDGPILVAARELLLTRALALGVAQPRRLDIEITGAGRLTAVVPGDAEIVRLFSRSGFCSGDRRRLGAMVDGLWVDGDPVPLQATCFAYGFHGVEVCDGRTLRWTNGGASLALGCGGADRQIEIDVALLIAEQAIQQPIGVG